MGNNRHDRRRSDTPRTGFGRESLRTLAIGLDGASWNVLEPLVAEGSMPQLEALIARGATATVEGTIPYEAVALWASFATGAPPGMHGILDTVHLKPDGTLGQSLAEDLRCPIYAAQLGDNGKRSVLINLPIDLHGCDSTVIVNSWITTDESRRILPVGRRSRYDALLRGLRRRPRNVRDVKQLCEYESARFDLAREMFLTEKWDHFFVLFSLTDLLGREATGRFLRGDADAREAFRRLYRQLDEYIGWFVGHAPNSVACVFSVNGHSEEIAILRINSLLQELGLVAVWDRGAPPAGELAWSPEARATIRVPGWLGRQRGNPRVRPLALHVKSLLRRRLNVDVTAPSWGVDITRSRAFTPTDTCHAIYVREDAIDEVPRIREALRGARLDDNRAAIANVWRPEGPQWSPVNGFVPALLFSCTPGVRPSATVRERPIDFPHTPGGGCHRREGFAVIAGPPVEHVDLGYVSVCDLAPTLLLANGVSVPPCMGGRVLSEAFDPEFTGAPLTGATPNGNGARADGLTRSDVVERLKALGYI